MVSVCIGLVVVISLLCVINRCVLCWVVWYFVVFWCRWVSIWLVLVVCVVWLGGD